MKRKSKLNITQESQKRNIEKIINNVKVDKSHVVLPVAPVAEEEQPKQQNDIVEKVVKDPPKAHYNLKSYTYTINNEQPTKKKQNGARVIFRNI